MADETELILLGYIAFFDPPKDTSATRASRRCARSGVAVKILTGDNELVTRKVCNDVGMHDREDRDRAPAGGARRGGASAARSEKPTCSPG